jgi:hypothetical protein
MGNSKGSKCFILAAEKQYSPKDFMVRSQQINAYDKKNPTMVWNKPTKDTPKELIDFWNTLNSITKTCGIRPLKKSDFEN